MSSCKVCGRSLLSDEEGISMKLLGMGTEEFFCVDCLAAYMKIKSDTVRSMIERFRAEGCQLFAPKE